MSLWDEKVNGIKKKMIVHFLVKHNNSRAEVARSLGVTRELVRWYIDRFELNAKYPARDPKFKRIKSQTTTA